MIKTRIPPLSSDIGSLSFVHSSTCLSKLHPHDVTQPVVQLMKQVNKNILYEKVGGIYGGN